MKIKQISTKVIPLGSTAFRQWRAKSHCRLLHGYRLSTKIYFYAEDLDETNWIFDFGNCKEIKAILENQFDHTTCVAADDPELDLFVERVDSLNGEPEKIRHFHWDPIGHPKFTKIEKSASPGRTFYLF